VPDIKLFFCPSGNDVRRPTDKYGHKVNDSLGDVSAAAAGLPGADPGRMLTHGNWPRYTDSIGVYDNKVEYNVAGQYGYRNAAIYGAIYYDKAPGYNPMSGPQPVAYTRPTVKSAVACPAFKTARHLGNRALVADDFWKGKKDNHPIVEGAMTDPGFGIMVHKEGYNVLFGDGSAAWFGDPQRRLIYWDTSTITGGYGALGMTWHWIGGGPASWPWQNTAPRIFARNGTPLAWHMIDEWRGLDVGAAAGVP
jgi:prepilin-type processing-associated H-X9-DG protein